jgi:hypothetical protein
MGVGSGPAAVASAEGGIAEVGVGRVDAWMRGLGALEAVDLRFLVGWPLA